MWEDGFCCGTTYGLIVATIVGVILIKIREAKGAMKSKDKAFDTFPDAAHPNLTSLGVVKGCIQAMISYGVWLVFLIVFIVIAVGIGRYILDTGL